MDERDERNPTVVLKLEKERRNDFKTDRNQKQEAEKAIEDMLKKQGMEKRNDRIVFKGKQTMLRSRKKAVKKRENVTKTNDEQEAFAKYLPDFEEIDAILDPNSQKKWENKRYWIKQA